MTNVFTDANYEEGGVRPHGVGIYNGPLGSSCEGRFFLGYLHGPGIYHDTIGNAFMANFNTGVVSGQEPVSVPFNCVTELVRWNPERTMAYRLTNCVGQKKSKDCHMEIEAISPEDAQKFANSLGLRVPEKRHPTVIKHAVISWEDITRMLTIDEQSMIHQTWRTKFLSGPIQFTFNRLGRILDGMPI